MARTKAAPASASSRGSWRHSMGGNQQPPPEPAGYSTQLGGEYGSGYHTTGYKKIIIDPDTLQDSIDTFRKQLDGKSIDDLRDTLTKAVVYPFAFGQIP